MEVCSKFGRMFSFSITTTGEGIYGMGIKNEEEVS